MTLLYVPTDGISHRAQPSPVKPVRKVARKSRTAMSSGAAKGAVTSRASSTPNPPRSSTDSGPTRSSAGEPCPTAPGFSASHVNCPPTHTATRRAAAPTDSRCATVRPQRGTTSTERCRSVSWRRERSTAWLALSSTARPTSSGPPWVARSASWSSGKPSNETRVRHTVHATYTARATSTGTRVRSRRVSKRARAATAAQEAAGGEVTGAGAAGAVVVAVVMRSPPRPRRPG